MTAGYAASGEREGTPALTRLMAAGARHARTKSMKESGHQLQLVTAS